MNWWELEVNIFRRLLQYHCHSANWRSVLSLNAVPSRSPILWFPAWVHLISVTQHIFYHNCWAFVCCSYSRASASFFILRSSTYSKRFRSMFILNFSLYKLISYLEFHLNISNTLHFIHASVIFANCGFLCLNRDLPCDTSHKQTNPKGTLNHILWSPSVYYAANLHLAALRNLVEAIWQEIKFETYKNITFRINSSAYNVHTNLHTYVCIILPSLFVKFCNNCFNPSFYYSPSLAALIKSNKKKM